MDVVEHSRIQNLFPGKRCALTGYAFCHHAESVDSGHISNHGGFKYARLHFS